MARPTASWCRGGERRRRSHWPSVRGFYISGAKGFPSSRRYIWGLSGDYEELSGAAASKRGSSPEELDKTRRIPSGSRMPTEACGNSNWPACDPIRRDAFHAVVACRNLPRHRYRPEMDTGGQRNPCRKCPPASGHANEKSSRHRTAIPRRWALDAEDKPSCTTVHFSLLDVKGDRVALALPHQQSELPPAPWLRPPYNSTPLFAIAIDEIAALRLCAYSVWRRRTARKIAPMPTRVFWDIAMPGSRSCPPRCLFLLPRHRVEVIIRAPRGASHEADVDV